MKLLTTLFFSLAILFSFAQVPDDYADKIVTYNELIATANSPINKAELFLEKARYQSESFNFEAAINSAKDGLSFVLKRSNPRLFSDLNLLISDVNQRGEIFNIDKAVFYAEEAYQVYNEVSDEQKIQLSRRRSVSYYAAYNFEKAIVDCRDCLEISKKIGAGASEYGCLILMNNLLGSSPVTEVNQEYAERVLQMSKTYADSCGIAIRYTSRATSIPITDSRRIVELIDTALLYSNGCKPPFEFPILYKLLAGAYENLGDYPNTYKYYDLVVNTSKEMGIVHHIIHANIFYAQDAIRLKRYDDALGNLEKVVTLDPSKLTLYELDLYHQLKYQALRESKRYEDALFAYEEYQSMLDSIEEINNYREINTIERKYAGELQNEKLAVQEEQLVQKTQNLRIYSAIATILALLLGVLAFVYNRARNSRKIIEKKNILIQNQKEELLRIDKLKTKFFTNVSHELRTPLTLIIGPLQSLMNEKNISERGKKHVQRATESGKDLLKMINSILDISKMDDGKLVKEEEEITLFPFVSKIVDGFDFLASEKEINLEIECLVNKANTYKVDGSKVERIMVNLIFNAFKFTPSNGEIKVKLTELKNDLSISVQDNGIGISKQDVDLVFNRFFMASNNEKSTEGTGIGLSLAKEYALFLGGDLRLESKEGKGSTFTLTFPKMLLSSNAKTEENLQDLTLAYGGAASHGKEETADKSTILVLEDNDKLRLYLYELLEPNYKVITAKNGLVGLEKLNPNIALILTDYMMPKMDGKEFVQALKKEPHYKSIPVIMLTAKGDKESKLDILSEGINEYMIKPFNEEELLVKVKNLVRIIPKY